jgi:hypothetical protein
MGRSPLGLLGTLGPVGPPRRVENRLNQMKPNTRFGDKPGGPVSLVCARDLHTRRDPAPHLLQSQDIQTAAYHQPTGTFFRGVALRIASSKNKSLSSYRWRPALVNFHKICASPSLRPTGTGFVSSLV